jgi:PAS domain S-box-containing protein
MVDSNQGAPIVGPSSAGTGAEPLVLVTDDDRAGRYALVHPLRLSGFRVAEAGNGADTLRLAAELRPDAVVLDINLPDMDGRDVCRQLRVSPDMAGMPIVQVSATNRSDEDWASSLDRGADVFLPQPVPPAVLIATLKALLRTREAERRLEETLYSITDAYLALDDDWRFLAMNRRAEEIFGFSLDDVRGKPWAGHADPSRVIVDQYERARREGQPVHFEAQSAVLRRWFEIHAYPRPGRLDIYMKDITDRKRADEELSRSYTLEKELRTEAEAGGRAKDEFLAVLSHELRTPMNAILGWLTILRSGSTTPELAAKAMDVIHRNVMAQNQLIVDLLDVSRIVSGKMMVDRVPVDPAEPVFAALETVRTAAEAKRIRITANVVRGLAVAGDPDRLYQVATNLIANAVKFTGAGGAVTVTLAGNGDMAELVVTDTGEGIDPAFLPHVFERFRQADASRTRRYRGLGLGLAIAHYLVEEHHGTLTAYSAGPGQGSTFTMRLPLVDETPIRLDSIAAGKVQPAELPGLRVLVVDDEEDSRGVVAVMLEQSGARVTSTASVASALEALRAGIFDVVVSDIEMPGEDGYSLIAHMRRTPRLAALPVIALTAHAGEAERDRALAAGFAAHVAKPVGEGRLTAIVARVARVARVKTIPPA